MPIVLRPPGEHVTLPDRLRALGSARKLTRVAAGLLTLAAVLVAGLTLACSLDVAVHLPPAARAVLLAALAAGGGLAFHLCVRRPAREPASPQAVAQLLETRFPELNDAVASAAALYDRGGGGFRAATVARAEWLAEREGMAAVVPTGRLWRAVWLAAAAGAVAVPLALTNVGRSATAVLRFVAPYAGHQWPSRTHIDLADPPKLLARGEPFPIAFVVRGEIPAAATLHVRGGGAFDESVPLTADEADPERAAAAVRLDPDRVSRDFEFRVTANDADTGWHAVRVAPPPRLVPLDGRPSPRVRVAFPDYTQLAAVELPDGTAAIEAVAGTRVTLAAATDRPVVSAALVFQGDPLPVRLAAAVAPLAGFSSLTAAAEPFAESFLADIPVSVADGTRLWASFVPVQAGVYALRFTDPDGLTGVRLFDLRPYPDPPPVVTLPQPATTGEPLVRLPSATIAVRGRADDETFAAKELMLEHRVNDGPTTSVRLAAAPVVGGVLGGAVSHLRPRTLATERTLPVAFFRRPDGKPPQDGDVIHVRAAGTDWDDYTLMKEPGRSAEVVIRVYSADSLTAEIQKGLAALRPDVGRAVDAQKDAAAKLAEAQKPSPDQREAIAQAEQANRQLRAQVADAQAGLRVRAERLRDAARANDLPRSPATERAEAVARALADADERGLRNVEPRLAAARLAADTKEAARQLGRAARDQADAAEKLAAALEELDPWAGPAEVRGDARAIREQVAKAAGQTGDKAADQFREAADRTNRLLSKAERVAAERRATAGTPGETAKQAAAEAAAVEKAEAAAGGQELPNKLREAADAARAGRTGDASAAAKAALDRLDNMAAALAEQPRDGADELAKKRKAVADEVEKLADKQDELAKKAKAAGDDAETLNRLAGEQDELRKQAERLARQAARDGAPEAAEELRRAAREMEAARDELDQGRPPDAAQQDALDRLKDAGDKLQGDPMKEQEELLREKREELANQFKGFVERQAAAVAEAERISKAAAAAKRWERPVLGSLAALAEREKALGEELRRFAETKFADLKVFDRMARQAADRMAAGAVRLTERKDDALAADPAAFDAEAEAAADAVARRPLVDALKRLEQIAASLKPDDKKKPQPAGGGPMGGGAGGGGAGGQGGGNQAGVPPLAQLKALRDWQAEVNEKTAAFAKAHPDAAKLTDDEADELKQLEAAQKDIAELFEQLLPQFSPQAPDIP